MGIFNRNIKNEFSQIRGTLIFMLCIEYDNPELSLIFYKESVETLREISKFLNKKYDKEKVQTTNILNGSENYSGMIMAQHTRQRQQLLAPRFGQCLGRLEL